MAELINVPTLTLDRSRPLPVDPPQLDEDQQRVVAHQSGPLLVLAGPGTGKTTTLVEAMVQRLQGDHPLAADQVLGLTFGRKAALEWKQRVTARLGGGLIPTVTTFHSFAYACVRAQSDPEVFAEPLRLLSGAEQEARLRELLQGSVRDGSLQWPTELAAALGTRGLAAEVRALIAKVRSLGLDPEDLAALAGQTQGIGPVWRAVAQFFAEYLDVLDAEGVTDYTEIIHRASILVNEPEVQTMLRHRYRAIFVDEYQDTDPAQVRLLRGLADPSGALVVVGDPDQSIYTFRGADSSGIAQFSERFTHADGRPADIIVLGRTRRFGPTIGQAAGRILRSATAIGLPANIVRAHRNLTYEGPTDGLVEVRTFDTPSSEAAHIATTLRRAHLEQGIGWDQMAVLVRSGRKSIGPLRRALGAAGVPVEVAGDEIPLRDEPALAPLLAALGAVLDPAGTDEMTYLSLLRSPIADADPSEIRRLGRVMRRQWREQTSEQAPPRSDALVASLIRELIENPAALLPVSDSSRDDVRARGAAAAAARLAAVIRAGRQSLAGGGNTEDVLWSIWSATAGPDGTGWPQRLQGAALRGGDVGRRADADLDAVVALFSAARRAEDRFGGRRGVINFLADLSEQQIPADTLADRGIRGPAVRVLTAHRAKGLQWRVVCVAGVQEGAWPDIRRRGSLLASDRLERTGLVDAPSAASLLAEERRLFYVACTRASQQLHVSAVKSRADDGPQPSRFLSDLLGRDCTDQDHVFGRPPRPLSIQALVADLRSTAVNPDAEPALITAASRRLAVLASARNPDGRPMVPSAHPDRWWGIRSYTTSEIPVRPPDRALSFSGSQLSSITECPLRWFLSHEVHADVSRSVALSFGSVIHELADAVARGEIPADEAVLGEYLDRVWAEVGYAAQWQSKTERAEAAAALRRFLNWQSGRPDRHLLASEAGFEVTIAFGSRGIHVRGSFDRVEVDVEGAVHIVDLKTQRQSEPAAKLASHAQLGMYQVAVQHGALDDLDGAERIARNDMGPVVGGAELVLLRLGKAELPTVQEQAPLDPDNPWLQRSLEAADLRIREEEFTAIVSPRCDTCSFRAACPAQPEGQVVVT